MKKKRIIISVSTVAVLIAVVVSIILFTDAGFIFTKSFLHRTVYSEYTSIDNFSESDFEIIKHAVVSDGQGDSYYLDQKSGTISCYIDNDVFTSNVNTVDLTLSNEVKKAILNIKQNKELSRLCFIEIQDGYIEFAFDATGCSIVSTDNIRQTVAEFEDRSMYDHKYACTWLGGNWYSVYI